MRWGRVKQGQFLTCLPNWRCVYQGICFLLRLTEKQSRHFKGKPSYDSLKARKRWGICWVNSMHLQDSGDCCSKEGCKGCVSRWWGNLGEYLQSVLEKGAYIIYCPNWDFWRKKIKVNNHGRRYVYFSSGSHSWSLALSFPIWQCPWRFQKGCRECEPHWLFKPYPK